MRLMCHLILISRLRMGKRKSSLGPIWRERVLVSEPPYVIRAVDRGDTDNRH
jgi:hypothetical protein